MLDFLNHINTTVAILGSLATIIATLVGVWINISKNKKEANIERLELLESIASLKETMACLTVEVKDIKQQNAIQQNDIETSKYFAKAHFRMTIYNSMIKAIERGFTTVDEATEITKMFAIYKKYGGNGEIELLYSKYDTLEIKGE